MARSQKRRRSNRGCERCLTVLRAGLKSDEFWPAMHAAEGLTVAGQGRRSAGCHRRSRTAADDQKHAAWLVKRCGPAIEAKSRCCSRYCKSPDRTATPTRPRACLKSLKSAMAAPCGRRWQGRRYEAEADGCCGAGSLRPSEGLDIVRGSSRVTMSSTVKRRFGSSGRFAALATSSPFEKRCPAKRSAGPAYCINALACLGDEKAKRLLGENLRSESPAVRTYSAEFAGYCRATSLRDELIKLARRRNARCSHSRGPVADRALALAGASGPADRCQLEHDSAAMSIRRRRPIRGIPKARWRC